MNKKLFIFLFTASSIFLTTGFTVQYVSNSSKNNNAFQANLKNYGYSDKIIKTASDRFINPYNSLDFDSPKNLNNNFSSSFYKDSNIKYISLDPASDDLNSVEDTQNNNNQQQLPPIRQAENNSSLNTELDDNNESNTKPSYSSTEGSRKSKTSSAKSYKSYKKSNTKYKGKSKAKARTKKAPIVTTSSQTMGTIQQNSYSGRTGLYDSGKEIYSQEPIKLPPVSSLPEPARIGGSGLNLPPIAGDPMAFLPVQEAVSRLLAANFAGLTGMIFTTSADVSKAGTFKSGFHTSWFKLDRVYDRVLASGESGEIFEVPLFFNYALTDDLEFALCLPIVNYTIKSRILWTRDFRESGIGDSKLSFKYRIFDNPQHQMRGAFGVGFKFPTGSDEKGLGTGKTDFEVFTAFSKSYEKIIAHLNLGYVMTGDPNTQFYPDGLADIFYYNVGIELHHNQNIVLMAEVNGQDWGAEGLRIDVTPAIRYIPNENFALELGVPISVTNEQRYGYNYRLIFGMNALFK